MSIEAIKKALEAVILYPGPWEVGGLIKRRPYSEAWELQNATDLFGYIYCGHEAPEDVKPVVEFIAAANPVAVTELISTLESLQRENEALREDRYKLAYAITGGEDAPGLLDSTPTSEIVEIAQHAHRMHQDDIARAEAAESEVKHLREALQNMMGIYDTPLSRRRMQPDAFMTEALNTARTALASTGGDHHGN